VIYASDQTHSSVLRAARLLGFRADQVRSLPTDHRYQVRLDALMNAVVDDERAGRRPLIVVADAGATNTGAIDPLNDLAEVCSRRGMWLHVDAAYGGFAALTERGRHLLSGLERADSVTLDPHKWLYQPIECGCVLVREPHLLDRVFSIAPDYLDDYRGGEVDLCDRGLQLTRAALALKVWLSVQYFGADAFAAAIDRALDLASPAEQMVADHPELELLCPATLGVVCFRRRPRWVCNEHDLERLNAVLVGRLVAIGAALVSSTRLYRRYGIRMCVMKTHHVPWPLPRRPGSPSAAQGLWPPWLATCGSPRRCDSPTPRSRRSLLVRWDTVGLDVGHYCSAYGWGVGVYSDPSASSRASVRPGGAAG
jgi:aromatic-L-amino-acid/L-tryptophan decarboxylase